MLNLLVTGDKTITVTKVTIDDSVGNSTREWVVFANKAIKRNIIFDTMKQE